MKVDTTVRALTIRQPWASLIAHADKRVESRTWSTGWRGTLLIHAAKSPDLDYPDAELWRGGGVRAAIVAVARLADCHPGDGPCTVWSETGAFHWVLADVVPLPAPVPAAGRLGLWTPGADVLDAIRSQLGRGAL